MGKLDVSLLKFLSWDDFRVLATVDRAMNTHELVPKAKIVAMSRLKRGGSATARILKDLTEQRLLCYERGKRYDGYRINTAGRDYLALNELCKRNIITHFGYQFGIGKESDIYFVEDSEGNQKVLKLHRLGRTSFRKIKEKRDYHTRGKRASWANFSDASARKEYNYMKALHERGFSVPEPFGVDRHCVVMEYIKGRTLNDVSEVTDPAALYDKLIDLVVRLAECGVIHGDFNEFNIVLNEEEDPILIDFPQMVSTEHPNAEWYFDRDLECVRIFFEKRFCVGSETLPKLSEIQRTDLLDADLLLSGMTKKMAKDLEVALGMGGPNEDSDGSDADNANGEDPNEVYLSSRDEEEENTAEKDKNTVDKEKEEEERDTFEERPPQNLIPLKTNHEINSIEDVMKAMRLKSEHANDSLSSGGEESDNQEEGNFDSRSCWSRASSVPPEEVKRRVKIEMKQRDVREQIRRARAKGTDSAVTRSRRENKEVVKQSKGWDF